MPVSVTRSIEVRPLRFPGGYHLRSGDGLSLAEIASFHASAYDPKVSDCLQLSKGFYLLLSTVNRAAVIAVIVQNNGFAVFFSKIEQPTISDPQLRQTCRLRREDLQR